MILRDISFSSPAENICFDDVLLHLAENKTGGEVLRFWESPAYFVVLGRIGKEEEDVRLDAARRDRIPVLRRSSGGGTVLQGRGCLNFSLVLSKAADPAMDDVRKSYRYILGKVIRALRRIGIDAEFHPTSDIALTKTRQKISGNAQKRGRKFILHHGTILYDFDLTLIERYLNMPKNVPEYRNGRDHLDFVANISVNPDDIKKAFRQEFGIQQETNRLDDGERACLDRFSDSQK